MDPQKLRPIYVVLEFRDGAHLIRYYFSYRTPNESSLFCTHYSSNAGDKFHLYGKTLYPFSIPLMESQSYGSYQLRILALDKETPLYPPPDPTITLSEYLKR